MACKRHQEPTATLAASVAPTPSSARPLPMPAAARRHSSRQAPTRRQGQQLPNHPPTNAIGGQSPISKPSITCRRARAADRKQGLRHDASTSQTATARSQRQHQPATNDDSKRLTSANARSRLPQKPAASANATTTGAAARRQQRQKSATLKPMPAAARDQRRRRTSTPPDYQSRQRAPFSR